MGETVFSGVTYQSMLEIAKDAAKATIRTQEKTNLHISQATMDRLFNPEVARIYGVPVVIDNTVEFLSVKIEGEATDDN